MSIFPLRGLLWEIYLFGLLSNFAASLKSCRRQSLLKGLWKLHACPITHIEILLFPLFQIINSEDEWSRKYQVRFLKKKMIFHYVRVLLYMIPKY